MLTPSLGSEWIMNVNRCLGTIAPMLLACAGMTGCVAPIEAPTDLDALSRFMFVNAVEGGEGEREAALIELESLLSQTDPLGSIHDRKWRHEPMTAQDVEGLDDSVGDPAMTVGVSVLGFSEMPVEAHIRLHSDAERALELAETEPMSVEYSRQFIQPQDPQCLSLERCNGIQTQNEVLRKSGLDRVTVIFRKDFFTHTFTDEDGLERIAMISKSWQFGANREPGTDKEKDKGVLQSYNVDVWLSAPQGGTFRYQANWSETKIVPAVGEDVLGALVASSIDGIIAQTDDVIETWYPEFSR